MLRTLSCARLPAMRASARNRALTSSSSQPCSVRIFTATVRPITVSRARYTCDMPPPRNSSSSYLPIFAGSCMVVAGRLPAQPNVPTTPALALLRRHLHIGHVVFQVVHHDHRSVDLVAH